NRSLHTDISDKERATKSEEQAVEIVQKPAAQTVAAAQPTSSAEYLVGEIKRHKTATTLIIMALSIAAIAAIILRFYPSRTSPQMKINSLTNSGKSVCAAISPDGKHVPHAEEAEGKQALLFTSIATAGASQI